MSDPVKTKKPKDKITALDDPGQLGLSKRTYAFGSSFEQGLIWGLIAFVASMAILAFGRERFKSIGEVANVIEKGHKAFKGGLANAINWVGKYVFRIKELEGGRSRDYAPITAVSFVAAGVVGHAAQILGIRPGLRDAQKASDKYDKMRREDKELAHENQILAEDNARLNEALAKVSRPNPTAEKETGASLGV